MVLIPNLERDRAPMIMKASLSQIAKSHTLRCDAKQSERRFSEFARFIASVESFRLGDYIPNRLVKGAQPKYIESLDTDGVPVISTITVQNLTIKTDLCRYILQEDFDSLDKEKKPRPGDVLLTMDGGTSIGKPALFDLEEDYAIDSHVARLRPVGLEPRYLVYLLASPLGQIQFNQAESGASGQTAVTEEDIRRFRFPVLDSGEISKIVDTIDDELRSIIEQMQVLKQRDGYAWDGFTHAHMK